jgi:hypothetical protein
MPEIHMKQIKARTDRKLFVQLDGKRYPVTSMEDARDKWNSFREATAAGVSEIGCGIDVCDEAGRLVGRISYNGRMWDTDGKEWLASSQQADKTMSSTPQKAGVTPLKRMSAVSPKRKSPPIPANVAAIWGAFLYEGLLACYPNRERGTEILRRWALGCDHLMAEVCAYLPEVWQQVEPRWYEKDFPGVFEYEVIAPLGVSIGDYLLLNNGQLPPRDVVKDYIRDLVADFFRHGSMGVELPRDGNGCITT